MSSANYHGGDKSKAIFLLTKQGRNFYRETFLGAELSSKEKNIEEFKFELSAQDNEIIEKCKFILSNQEYIKNKVIEKDENDHQLLCLLSASESFKNLESTKDITDDSDDEIIDTINERFTEPTENVEASIDADAENKGPIIDALNVFHPIMLSLE